MTVIERNPVTDTDERMPRLVPSSAPFAGIHRNSQGFTGVDAVPWDSVRFGRSGRPERTCEQPLEVSGLRHFERFT